MTKTYLGKLLFYLREVLGKRETLPQPVKRLQRPIDEDMSGYVASTCLKNFKASFHRKRGLNMPALSNWRMAKRRPGRGLRACRRRSHFPTLIPMRLFRDELRSKRFSDFMVKPLDCRVVNTGLTVGSFSDFNSA